MPLQMTPEDLAETIAQRLRELTEVDMTPDASHPETVVRADALDNVVAVVVEALDGTRWDPPLRFRITVEEAR